MGPATLDNTYPFRYGRWTLIHNGMIPHFGRLRLSMLDAMETEFRAQVRGVTDSKHFFCLMLPPHPRRYPDEGPMCTLRTAAAQVIA